MGFDEFMEKVRSLKNIYVQVGWKEIWLPY